MLQWCRLCDSSNTALSGMVCAVFCQRLAPVCVLCTCFYAVQIAAWCC